MVIGVGVVTGSTVAGPDVVGSSVVGGAGEVPGITNIYL